MNGWSLPQTACIRGKTYRLHTDFREILRIFGCLQQEQVPEFIRWHTALDLFFGEPIPEEAFPEAAAWFSRFVSGGQERQDPGGPVLIHWQRDAQVIVADINKAAGREIRELPYLHWWTFLAWFRGIGEGGLSTLVTVRDKLRRGKKLEPWEQEYYRRNRDLVSPRPDYTPQELEEQARLRELLASACEERKR